MGWEGRGDFVLMPPTLSEKSALHPRLAANLKTALLRMTFRSHVERTLRRPKFQSYMVPKSRLHRHICTVLTYTDRRGLRAHSTVLASENSVTSSGAHCPCKELLNSQENLPKREVSKALNPTASRDWDRGVRASGLELRVRAACVMQQ